MSEKLLRTDIAGEAMFPYVFIVVPVNSSEFPSARSVSTAHSRGSESSEVGQRYRKQSYSELKHEDNCPDLGGT